MRTGMRPNSATEGRKVAVLANGSLWLAWRAAVLTLCISLAASPILAAEDRDEWQQPDRVMHDLAIQPGASVADIGCGEGYFTFRLSQAVGQQGKVFAVDLSEASLKTIRQQIQREHLANIKAILSKPTKTGLPAESCDAALLCNMLHEVPQGQRLPLVQDVVRTLRPGGFLFLIEWRDGRGGASDVADRPLPRKDLVTLGTDAGLSRDAQFHYLKHQVFLRFRKPVPP
jgi:arsenite methyltransferase